MEIQIKIENLSRPIRVDEDAPEKDKTMGLLLKRSKDKFEQML